MLVKKKKKKMTMIMKMKKKRKKEDGVVPATLTTLAISGAHFFVSLTSSSADDPKERSIARMTLEFFLVSYIGAGVADG